MQSFHPDFLTQWRTWGERIAHFQVRRLAPWYGYHDYLQESTFAFSEALYGMDGEKHPIARAKAYIRNHLLTYRKRCSEVVKLPTNQKLEPVGAESLQVPAFPGSDETKQDLLPQPDTSCTEVRDISGEVWVHCTRRQWEMMDAKYFRGLTEKEIAKEYGVAPGSQYNYQQRGIKKLRKKLGGVR